MHHKNYLLLSNWIFKGWGCHWWDGVLFLNNNKKYFICGCVIYCGLHEIWLVCVCRLALACLKWFLLSDIIMWLFQSKYVIFCQTLAATHMEDKELTGSIQKLLIVMQRLDHKIAPLMESDGELFNRRFCLCLLGQSQTWMGCGYCFKIFS